MNIDLNFIKTYNDLAVNTYHVDPKIFVALILISIPLYWYGWFELGRGVLEFRNKHKNNDNIRVSDIFVDKKFTVGLTINRVAWVFPYFYVIFWGQNVPMWFWVVFLGWIAFSAYSFWYKIKKMVRKEKAIDEE